MRSNNLVTKRPSEGTAIKSHNRSFTLRGVLFALVLVGCGSESQPTGNRENDLPAAISKAAAGSAIFTFAYLAPPADGGRILHAWAFDGVANPCKLFSGAEPQASFFLLGIELNGTDQREYAITPSGGDGGAEVFYDTVVEGGVPSKVFATGGTVRYVAGPTNEGEWGENARLLVRAEFSSSGVRTVECGSGVDRDGGSTGSCLCRRADATEFSCTLTSGQQECCNLSETDRVTVETEFSASPCAAACAYAQPELGSYCADLQKGS